MASRQTGPKRGGRNASKSNRKRPPVEKKPPEPETPEEAEARFLEEIRQEVRDVRQLLKKDNPSESTLIQRWGMNFVAKLGQNSYPTKPQRWQNSLASVGKESSPKLARSSSETLPEISSSGPWGQASHILDFPGREKNIVVAEEWEVDSNAFEAALQQMPP